MLKSILIIATILLSFSCNKNGKNSVTSKIDPKVYCIFSNDNNNRIFHGCASSKTEMQNKTVSLRDQGYNSVSSVEKNSCSECQ